MNRLATSLTLLASALIAPAFAHADTFTISSVVGSSSPSPFTMSFSLPATPTDVTAQFGGFFVPVSVVRNGVTDSTDILTFYNTLGGGGLSDNDSSFEPFGPKLFTGTLANPTFILGTFDLSNENVGAKTDYILTIASGVAPTPEPSSLVLLGTGALGFVGAARRRFLK